jgi:hypothetical protein
MTQAAPFRERLQCSIVDHVAGRTAAMATMLAPNRITAAISSQFAAGFTASAARLTARRIANRLLNLLRRRAAFNEMMSLTPDVREDIGLAPAAVAERLLAVQRAGDEPLPGLGHSLSLFWRGWVVFGDVESRRCWQLALEMSPGQLPRVRK